MFKKNIKPILMAGALALATAVSPVLAYQTDNPGEENGQGWFIPVENNNASVPVNKYFHVQDGYATTDDDYEFTFKIQYVGAYKSDDISDNNKLEITEMPEVQISNQVLNFANNEATKTITFNKGVATSDDDFSFVFSADDGTKPGVYVFNISEDGSDTTTLNHDETTYQVKVRVVSTTKNGDLTTETVIDQIAIISSKNLDAKEFPYKKVDSADFNNYYEEYANLTVSKQVTGLGADQTDKFAFTFNLQLPDYYVENFLGKLSNGVTVPDTFKIKLNGKQYTETNNDKVEDKNLVFTNDNGKYKASLSLELGDNDEVVIEGLPVGTTYSVTENTMDTGNVTDYDGSYVLNSDSPVAENKEVNTLTATGAIKDTVANKVAFTNTKSSSPITGVIVNNMPYIALLGASGAGLVVLAASKKRSKK